MSSEEAINQITSEPKYYIGVMEQSLASHTVRRFRRGTITLNKLEEFLNAFGYVKRDGEWIKVKVEKPRLKYS